MARPVDSISKAISDNRVDGTWTVEKKDSCDTGKKTEMTRECKPGTSFDVKASYKNKSGAELIFFGHQPVKGVFRPDTGVNYSAVVNGKKVWLYDYYDYKDQAGAAFKPDEKLSPGDQVTIEGHNGAYDLMDKSFPSGNDQWKGQGIFVLTSQGGSYIGDADATDKIAQKYNSPFHGLEFKREGDQWKFVGPAHRAAQGKEAEALLNNLSSAYSTALSEAETHIKK